MKETIKAILARCNFNRNEAVDYCTAMAYEYPRLSREYLIYRDAFVHGEQKAEAAHV
jgi:hypothetical protein